MGGKNGAATMKRLFNERNKKGSTPVETMAEEGAMDAILQLWAHGADVSFADDSLKSKKVMISAYSFEHLISSHLGLAYVLLVETNPFLELVVIFPDCAIRISLGTFSIVLLTSYILF